MVEALRKQNLYRSTLIIISAKHGQSPIDRSKNRNIGNGQPGTFLGARESELLASGSAPTSLTAAIIW